jgi:iron complex outermembrane receptor protein
VPQENNYSMYTHWTLDVNEYNEFLIEASYVRSQGWTQFIATFPQTNGKPIVPASNPANPFGVDLTWTGRAMGLAYPGVKTDGDGTSVRLAGTWNGDFSQFTSANWAESWSFMLSYQYSDDRGIGENPDTDLRRIQDALNGYGGANCEIRFDGPSVSETPGIGNCSYYSPFGLNIYNTLGDPQSGYAAVMDADGNALPSNEVIEVLGFNAQTLSSDANERSLTVFEAVVTGDLFSLPGGPMGIALGYQNRHEIRERQVPNFQNNFAQGFLTPRTGGKGGRTIDAFFTELHLPVIESLDLQLAVRYEDYGDVDSTDPKIGVNWRVIDSLTLRGSWGTSFRAPSLGNVVGDDAQSNVQQVLDPVNPAEAGGAGTFRTIIFSKNPALLPEESENFNIGLSWAPELPWGGGSHAFQLDIDYFDFTFEKQIRVDDPIQVVATDPCGPQVVRDPVNFIVAPLPPPAGATPCVEPVGELLLVNAGFFNSGKTDTAGVDLSMVYTFDWLNSSWAIRSETTFLETYEVQVSDGGAIIDGAGFSNDGNPGVAAPKFKSNLMLNWIFGRHAANITVRHIDSVEDDAFGLRDGNKGLFGQIEDHTEVDVQYSIEFGPQNRYDIALGAINVFDNAPPDTFFRGYSEELHNPFMRQLYIRAGASF